MGTSKPVTVTGVTLGGADAANYTVSQPSGLTADITAAILTPHITANNKVYDGNTTATIATRTLTGVVGTEDVSLTGGTATFADHNVGSGKTVTATGLSLAGTAMGNYQLSSTSATTTADITKANTSTAVSSSLNPSFSGQSVMFTATVSNSSSSPVPTGSVQFKDGGVAIGSPVALTAGSASYSTSALTVGTHTITADFLGDTNFNTSTGTLSPNQVVKDAKTDTAISSSANPSVYGDSVSFKAIVTPQDVAAGTPTGSVQFQIGGVNFGSAVPLGACVPVVTAGACATSGSISSLSAAGHPVEAIYTPDVNFVTSHNSLTQTVDKANQTITWSDPAAITYGTALGAGQLNAVVTVPGADPHGAVTYTPAAGTILSAGPTQALKVDVATTTNYNAATLTVHINVNKADQAITWGDPADITYPTALSAVQLNATVSVPGPEAHGALTYTPPAGTTLDAGPGQALKVDVAESSNYNSATKTVHINVNKADSTTTVSVAGGESFTYNAVAHPATVSVTGAGGLSQTPAPDYSCLHAPKDVADSGCTASYSYAGDANHKPSSDSKTYTISRADPVMSATGGTFDYTGSPHAGSGSATGVGSDGALSPVTLNYVGVSGTVYPSSASAPTDAGDYTVTAHFAGNGNYNAKDSTPAALKINKADSTTVVSGGGSFEYDALAHGATVLVTGAGGLHETPAPVYSGACSAAPVNVAETPCTASYDYAGDANHNPSNGSTVINITKAPSTTAVSVLDATYDGSPHGGTASVTGIGGLSTVLPVKYIGRNATVYGPTNTAPTDAGDHTAQARYVGDANHLDSHDAKDFTIIKAASTTAVSVAGGETFTYDAVAHPATVSVTGAGSLSLTPDPVYTPCGHAPKDVVDSGCTASYNYAGDNNHTGSSDSKTYTISKASSATVVTFEAGPYTYRGTAFTATAAVTGVGGLSEAVSVVYSGDCLNVSVANGCTATANFGGDGNHNDSSDAKSITISKAASTTVLTFEAGPYTYRGTAFTATAAVTGVGSLSQAVSVVYSGDCLNVSVADGCTATATFDGDGNHIGSSDAKSITITKASATIHVTPYSVTYDGKPHTATGTATGVGGVDLSASLTLTGTTHTSAGTYASDAWTFTDSTGNYNNTSGTVSDSIAKADPTVTATGNTCTYNGSPCVGSGSATGVLSEPLAPVTLGYSATPGPGGLLPSAPVNAGSYFVAARFAGNANYNPKQSASAPITINKADTTTAFVSAIPSPSSAGTLVIFTAAVTSAGGTPTGYVGFTYSLVPIDPGAPLSGGIAMTGYAPIVSGAVQASYLGDANFNPSTSVILGQTVTTAPIAYLSPSSEVQFPNQALKTTSDRVPLILTNIGTAPLVISSIKLAGVNKDDFAYSSTNCPSSLAAPPQPVTLPLGGPVLSLPYSCTIFVTFRPDDTGVRTATLNITDNDTSSSPQMVGLTGLALSAIKSDFNKKSIAAGSTIWFSSSFSVKNPSDWDDDDGHHLGRDVSPNPVQLFFTDSTITFRNGSTAPLTTLKVPNAVIILDPAATTASTTWDATNNRWVTRVPSVDRHDRRKVFDVDGDVFLSGMGYTVPAGGLRGDIEPVTWSGSFTTDTPGISIKWRWGAAVYTQFNTDYAQLGVKPVDDEHRECSRYGNRDDAGTPENYKSFWVKGATGNERHDFTGKDSRTVGVPPSAAPLSLAPTTVDFGNVPAGSTSLVPKTVMVTNTGFNPITIILIQVGGTDAINFVQTNDCPQTLATMGFCTVSLNYTAEGVGTNSAVLSITSGPNSSSQSTQTVDLGGTGTP